MFKNIFSGRAMLAGSAGAVWPKVEIGDEG
jgi:hypothetical protein